uniref:Uncharacterized protein n=1 Tax=Panagrellus redivivus TaxID=6233 RepID=A0A7E4ZXS3_PANRE
MFRCYKFGGDRWIDKNKPLETDGTTKDKQSPQARIAWWIISETLELSKLRNKVGCVFRLPQGGTKAIILAVETRAGCMTTTRTTNLDNNLKLLGAPRSSD